MSRAGFIVSFDGPGVADGRIDVRDLAPALLSLGRMIDAANLAIHGEKRPIKVEVKAVAVGCFEVHLDAILSGWDLIKSVIDRGEVDEAKKLLEWMGLLGMPLSGVSLFKLYRWLRGRSPERVVTLPNNEFRFELDGLSITVPFEVMRLYRERAVNQAVGELLTTLRGDAIREISFFEEGRAPTDAPAETLTQADRASFSLAAPAPVVVTDASSRLALSIRSLAFQEGNKWRLFDGQNTITATIADEDFLNRVDLNLIRFAKDDILLCEVRTVQTQGTEGLKTEHTVLKVHEHKAAPAQIPLPFSAA